MRSIDCGVRQTFESEKFAGTMTVLPTGITNGGGSSWRPARGCRRRLARPGGSLPISIRASCPSSISVRAWFSACSTTPPQYDHENGTTMPTFTAAG